MKLRVEIDPNANEEIVIKIKEFNDASRSLIDAAGRLLSSAGELEVTDGEKDVFIRISDCLFFDTCDGRVNAHTADGDYVCSQKLYELEKILPRSFVRASKASIVNTEKISSMMRSLTGVTDAGFFGTNKTVSVSRLYYHTVKDTIDETRLAK